MDTWKALEIGCYDYKTDLMFYESEEKIKTIPTINVYLKTNTALLNLQASLIIKIYFFLSEGTFDISYKFLEELQYIVLKNV